MLMFHKDYGPKFSALVQAVAARKDSGTALAEVYGRSLSQIATDLNLYGRMASLPIASFPFQMEKPALDIRQATPFESGIALADLMAEMPRRDRQNREAYQKLAEQNPASWRPVAVWGMWRFGLAIRKKRGGSLPEPSS